MKRTFSLIALLLFISVLVTEAKKGKSKLQGRTCSRICDKSLRPVCGTDGKTYSNKCRFNIAKCLSEASKSGVVLRIKSQGRCVNSTAKNSKGKQPKVCTAGLAECLQVDNSTKRFVCGSDNTTYPSFCVFRVSRCQAKQNGRNLTMLYKGECGKPKAEKSGMCPVESQCDNQDKPICGSNGKTYKNTCVFVVAKCEARRQNKRLTLKRKGPCGKQTSFKPCPKKCPSKERPVCGSDKKTYKNGCHLAAAKCALPKNDRGSLRLEYDGPCGAPTTPKPCPRWEDCKIVDKPVCGSDGKTYPNICRLRVAMCHARRNKHRPIKLKYRDACKKGKRKNGKKDGKGKKDKKDRSGRKERKDRGD